MLVVSCGGETLEKMAVFSISVRLESKLDVFVDAWFQLNHIIDLTQG